MTTIPRMTDVIRPTTVGSVTLDHIVVSEHESRMSAFGGGLAYCPAGTYARLRVGGQCVMSDTRMERITNMAVIANARGDVLIAGLGIGMILVPILKKPDVRSVTVIEQNPDVITAVEHQIRQYVGPRAAKKLTVIGGDIYTWRPARKGRQFETIYFDIWTDVSSDNLQEMTALRRAFAGYLRAGGWAGCWKQDHLRDLKRQGR